MKRIGGPGGAAGAARRAAVAVAAEPPSRTEYVEQLEAICKPDAEATQTAMRGARCDLQPERLAVAAAQVRQGDRDLRRHGEADRRGAAAARRRSEARPSGSATWNRQESYLRQITADLRAGKAIKAQRLTARFIHSGNLANNVVIAFGFNYCSFKFSRYG